MLRHSLEELTQPLIINDKKAQLSAHLGLTELYTGLEREKKIGFDENIFKDTLKMLPTEKLMAQPESQSFRESFCPITTFNAFTRLARWSRYWAILCLTITVHIPPNDVACGCEETLAACCCRITVGIPLAATSAAINVVSYPLALTTSGLGLFACAAKESFCSDKSPQGQRVVRLVKEELEIRPDAPVSQKMEW